MKRILFVSRTLAWPDFHGGCVYPCRVLEALAEAGWVIDYLWLPGSLGSKPFRLPFRLPFIRRYHVQGAFSLPGQVYWKKPYATKVNMASLASGAEIILDFLWDAEQLPLGSKHTWILTHERMHRRAESYRKRGEVPDFRVIEEAEEHRLLDHAHGLLAIQEEDAAWMRHQFPGKPVVVMPPPFVPLELAKNDASQGVLFVGGKTAHNRAGLAWIVSEVWPQVIAALPDARLRVYGTVDTREIAEAAGVEMCGPVPDLSQAYAENAVAVVPLRFGSGLKIKLLEAMAHGCPAVATSVGAEGFREIREGQVCPVSDVPQTFAEHLILLLRDPAERKAVRERQYMWLRREAAPEVLAQRFLDAVES